MNALKPRTCGGGWSGYSMAYYVHKLIYVQTAEIGETAVRRLGYAQHFEWGGNDYV